MQSALQKQVLNADQAMMSSLNSQISEVEGRCSQWGRKSETRSPPCAVTCPAPPCFPVDTNDTQR